MLIGTKKRGEEKITVKKRVREKKCQIFQIVFRIT